MSFLEKLGDNYGFVFPGQGSQTVGMGKELDEKSEAARARLDQANETLGFDLREVMFEGPEEALGDTAISQPAIYTVSAMGLAAMNERAEEEDTYLAPTMVAGHSLGEFTALLAAEVIDFTTGLKLVRQRGKFMAEAGQARPGAMAAVLGMDDDKLAELVQEAAGDDVLTIANLNCPGQTVISGEVEALERFMTIAKDAGARRIARLPISIASHSALMEPAADQLNELFDQVTFHHPKMPVVSNSAGIGLTTAEEIREELRYHVVKGVNWTATVQTMAGIGISTLLEIGNGNVLAGLNRRIDKSISTLGLADIDIAS